MQKEDISRRDLLKLSALASLSTIPGCETIPAAAETPKGSPKKGLCITTKKPNWNKLLASTNSKWFYSWNSNKHPDSPQNIDFVPMIFGRWNIPQNVATAKEVAAASEHKTILGFNEPEHKNQGKLTVEEALENWPLLMDSGMRLGSPAAVHFDNEWMRTFMDGSEKRNYRVDFTCIHSYRSPNVEAFIKRLHAAHEMYGKPIWITEFAIGDWSAISPETNKYKPDRILSFMRELLPELEKLDIVERYSWFPASTTNPHLGTSALFNEKGNLTPLGEFYSTI